MKNALNYEKLIFLSINNIILDKFLNLLFIDYEFKINLKIKINYILYIIYSL